MEICWWRCSVASGRQIYHVLIEMIEVYRCLGLYSSRAELDEICSCVVSIYAVLSWIKSIVVIVYKFTVHEICCSELRSCAKVEWPSVTVLMVSPCGRKAKLNFSICSCSM